MINKSLSYWTSFAIQSLRPNSQYVIRDNEIEWLDDLSHPKPTKEEIEIEIQRLLSLEPLRVARESREKAYARESDTLFFKVQRGESQEQEWLDKVSEIRQRFPYPDESHMQSFGIQTFEEIKKIYENNLLNNKEPERPQRPERPFRSSINI